MDCELVEDSTDRELVCAKCKEPIRYCFTVEGELYVDEDGDPFEPVIGDPGQTMMGDPYDCLAGSIEYGCPNCLGMSFRGSRELAAARDRGDVLLVTRER